MKGGMAESQAGCAIWTDVSKETFERFTQFAYTGDYSIPKGGNRNRIEMQKGVMTGDSSSGTLHRLRIKRDKTEPDPDLVVAVPEPELESRLVEEAVPVPIERKQEADYGYCASKKDKKKRLKSVKGSSSFWEESPRPTTDPDFEPEFIPITRRDKYPERHSRVHSEDFNSLIFPVLASRNNHDKTCEPAEHFDPDQSYTEAFLSHASLYILGDLQLIDSLKALALFKLHKTLCVFRLDNGNAEDIVALARYAYSEEGGGGGLDEGIGGLRSLVCQYMATNALVLSFNDGFMDLLGDGGQLVRDFFKYEVQRIS
jgi:hypothetical protein